MILQQLLKILPAASDFKVMDEYKPVLEGYISRYDKSIAIKGDISNFLLYNNVYQTFHVELVDKVDDIWIINVR